LDAGGTFVLVANGIVVLAFITNAVFATLLAAVPGSAHAAVADGSFEAEGAASAWSAWHSCGNVAVPAPAPERGPMGNRFAAWLGSTGGPEVAGDMGICQQVRIPAAARVMLDFWARSGTTEADPSRAYQEVGFFDGANAMDWTAPMQTLVHGMRDSDSFRHYTFDVTPLAGQLLYLYFGVHGDGNPNAHTWLELGGVSLIVDVPAERPS
jgi:hypothetical protein